MTWEARDMLRHPGYSLHHVPLSRSRMEATFTFAASTSHVSPSMSLRPHLHLDNMILKLSMPILTARRGDAAYTNFSRYAQLRTNVLTQSLVTKVPLRLYHYSQRDAEVSLPTSRARKSR
jgi:hypothetical protein